MPTLKLQNLNNFFIKESALKDGVHNQLSLLEKKLWFLKNSMEVPTNKRSTFLLLSKNFEVNQ